jgi:hypothetical protein
MRYRRRYNARSRPGRRASYSVVIRFRARSSMVRADRSWSLRPLIGGSGGAIARAAGGSNGELLRPEAQASGAGGTIRQAGVDRSLDEVGARKASEIVIIDLADAAAVSRRDAFRLRSRMGDEFIEPAAPASNRGESAGLASDEPGQRRYTERGHYRQEQRLMLHVRRHFPPRRCL